MCTHMYAHVLVQADHIRISSLRYYCMSSYIGCHIPYITHTCIRKIYTYISMHARMHASMRMYICIYTYVYVYVYVYVSLHLKVYVYVCVNVYVYAYVYEYRYIYIYVHVHVHVYVYVYTYMYLQMCNTEISLLPTVVVP